MTRKVFIPQVPTRFDHATQERVPSLDLNPARQYGEFVEMTHYSRPGRTDEALAELKTTIRHATADDLILVVGDIVLVAAAISMMNDMFGRALVLRWDRDKKSYDFVEVRL